MRFLIDNNLPPRFAAALNSAGHDAVHIRDVASPSVDDDVIMLLAADQKRIVVAQDSDFGTRLSASGKSEPSVIYFRRTRKSVEDLLPILLEHLAQIAEDLAAGAIVVFDDDRIRIRRLPIV